MRTTEGRRRGRGGGTERKGRTEGRRAIGDRGRGERRKKEWAERRRGYLTVQAQSYYVATRNLAELTPAQHAHADSKKC